MQNSPELQSDEPDIDERRGRLARKMGLGDASDAIARLRAATVRLGKGVRVVDEGSDYDALV